LRKFIAYCLIIIMLSLLFTGCGKKEKDVEDVIAENTGNTPGDTNTGQNPGNITGNTDTGQNPGNVPGGTNTGQGAGNMPGDTDTGGKSGTADTGKEPTSSTIEESQVTENTGSRIFGDPEFVLPEKGVRPVAVMIDNEGTKPLPQGGIDKAQVVYEAVVEFGITRIMAVFWNVNPDMIGPVRSARHYFLDYSMEHDAIYIHVGWSPMAERDIEKFGINNANGVKNGGWIFFDITNDPYNWQDTYTSMDKILQYAKSAGYSQKTERTVFRYREEFRAPEEGMNAEHIELVYSSYTCGYEYNSETGMYKRYRVGKPHMERVSEKQLECANIIIQKVRNYTIEGDNEGRQHLETVGKGTGYYITCGKAIEIEWSKNSRTEPTMYKDASGNEIILNPGRTWVQIMPLYGKISIK
jgi:hypothetical protein